MKPPKRYIEDFYGGKGCDFKVREVYPPEPSSSACDLYPEGNTACDFDPNGNSSCDFDPSNGVARGDRNEAVERGPNTLSKEIKSVSALVSKHVNKCTQQ